MRGGRGSDNLQFVSLHSIIIEVLLITLGSQGIRSYTMTTSAIIVGIVGLLGFGLLFLGLNWMREEDY